MSLLIHQSIHRSFVAAAISRQRDTTHNTHAQTLDGLPSNGCHIMTSAARYVMYDAKVDDQSGRNLVGDKMTLADTSGILDYLCLTNPFHTELCLILTLMSISVCFVIHSQSILLRYSLVKIACSQCCEFQLNCQSSKATFLCLGCSSQHKSDITTFTKLSSIAEKVLSRMIVRCDECDKDVSLEDVNKPCGSHGGLESVPSIKEVINQPLNVEPTDLEKKMLI